VLSKGEAMVRDPKDLNDPTSEALAAIEEAINRFEGRQASEMLKSESATKSEAAHLDSSLARVMEQSRSVSDQFGSYWVQLLLLQLALVGGLFYHRAINDVSSSWLDESWKAIFGLLGAAALGFGAAALRYSRFDRSQSAEIRQKYDRLKDRADRLVLMASQLNSKTDVR
jgi:hypothetical protein